MEDLVFDAVEYEHGTDVYLDGQLLLQSSPTGEVYWKTLLDRLGIRVINHFQDDEATRGTARLTDVLNLAAGERY